MEDTGSIGAERKRAYKPGFQVIQHRWILELNYNLTLKYFVPCSSWIQKTDHGLVLPVPVKHVHVLFANVHLESVLGICVAFNRRRHLIEVHVDLVTSH
jgi:hypothetical protein